MGSEEMGSVGFSLFIIIGFIGGIQTINYCGFELS